MCPILIVCTVQKNGVTRWQLTRSKGRKQKMTFIILPVYTFNNVVMGRILSFYHDNNNKNKKKTLNGPNFTHWTFNESCWKMVEETKIRATMWPNPPVTGGTEAKRCWGGSVQVRQVSRRRASRPATGSQSGNEMLEKLEVEQMENYWGATPLGSVPVTVAWYDFTPLHMDGGQSA